MKKTRTVVIGVIGADVHTVGIRVMELALQESGFKVVNLGVMVSQEEFIEAAIETNADAIWISSVYGHGELDCSGFREKSMESGLRAILIYVGGNLVVGKQEWGAVERKFKSMGFDRVYPSDISSLERAIADLKKDLA